MQGWSKCYDDIQMSQIRFRLCVAAGFSFSKLSRTQEMEGDFPESRICLKVANNCKKLLESYTFDFWGIKINQFISWKIIHFTFLKARNMCSFQGERNI